jgi:hypothetical protein
MFAKNDGQSRRQVKSGIILISISTEMANENSSSVVRDIKIDSVRPRGKHVHR